MHAKRRLASARPSIVRRHDRDIGVAQLMSHAALIFKKTISSQAALYQGKVPTKTASCQQPGTYEVPPQKQGILRMHQ